MSASDWWRVSFAQEFARDIHSIRLSLETIAGRLTNDSILLEDLKARLDELERIIHAKQGGDT